MKSRTICINQLVKFFDKQVCDAAFGDPGMYEYREAEGVGYAIRVRRYYASFSYQAQSWNKRRCGGCARGFAISYEMCAVSWRAERTERRHE